MIKKYFHMLVWSLSMDRIFLFRIPGIGRTHCIKFIFLKYYRFLVDSFLGMPGGSSSAMVFGRRFYYNDRFGLASLQRVYCEHYGLRNYVGDSPIVIDVGAHIGQFNYFCAHYLKASRVISMEPLAECFALLKLNALDERDCINRAAGGVRSMVTMYVSSSSTQQSSYVISASDTYIRKIDAAAETLDALLDRSGISGDIDVLKVDTEGSEYEILSNAERILHQVRTIAVEMSVLRESTGSVFKTGCLLEERGFVLREFDCFNVLNTAAANGIFVRGPGKMPSTQ